MKFFDGYISPRLAVVTEMSIKYGSIFFGKNAVEFQHISHWIIMEMKSQCKLSDCKRWRNFYNKFCKLFCFEDKKKYAIYRLYSFVKMQRENELLVQRIQFPISYISWAYVWREDSCPLNQMFLIFDDFAPRIFVISEAKKYRKLSEIVKFQRKIEGIYEKHQNRGQFSKIFKLF